MDWRLIEEQPGAEPAARHGPANMATDTALLESVKAGGRPVLRFYRWSRACLSFGRNQPVGRLRSRVSAPDLPFDVVRRPTGGSAVYHDRELTYAAVLPVGLLGSPRDTYTALNRALIAGLRRLGVRAETAALLPGAASADLNLGPCFRAAAPGEVVVAGRKLVGSAQRRERRALLQHGSLLLEGDQGELRNLFVPSSPTSADPSHQTTVALADILGRIPPWSTLLTSLRQGFEEALGICFAPGGLSQEEQARIDELERHYRSGEWTWRR